MRKAELTRVKEMVYNLNGIQKEGTMSNYAERLQKEYGKLKRYLDGIAIEDDPMGLDAYEKNYNQWWDRLSEKAKTDEQKQIIEDAKTLIRVTFERQRNGGTKNG